MQRRTMMKLASIHVLAAAVWANMGEASAQTATEQAPPRPPAQVPSAAPVQIPAASPTPAARLRFDGLYGGDAEEGGYTYWIRFYADGTVLTASSTGNAEQVSRWLDKDFGDVSKGTIQRDGLALSFSSTSSYGTVDYQGTIGVDELDLASHSRINGHDARRLYRFHPIEGW